MDIQKTNKCQDIFEEEEWIVLDIKIYYKATTIKDSVFDIR